jgi:hypothetical protein
LEQDPSKPLPRATGTSTKQPASSGPVPSLPLAPNPQAKFDPIELVEDFEHPICQLCLSLGMVRDENGIKMVTCDYCGAPGQRRPRKETDEDGIEMVMCEERSLPGVYAYLRNATCT